MAFAANGNLLVAHFGMARIDVFAPDGSPLDPIPVPGLKPTNCAFGGPNRDKLVVTEVATGSVYSYQLDFAGQPLNDR